MWVLNVCLVIVVLQEVIHGQDVTSDSDNTPLSPLATGVVEEAEARDLNRQEWRAVDFPAPGNNNQWIPQTDDQQPPLKRRRLRKRKRRPQIRISTSTTTEDSSQSSQDGLMDQNQSWNEEMLGDSTQKPVTRRRLTPLYHPQEVEDETSGTSDNTPHSYEQVRDPFTAMLEAQTKQKTEGPKAIADLKMLLRNGGGLSLSEVLQQKNLSLSELLTGNREAIQALVHKNTSSESGSVKKYHRVPPTKGWRVRDEETSSSLTSDEVEEAQRKRHSLLHNKVGEHVTTRTDEQMTTTTRHLPLTSAKLNKMASTTPPPQTTPIKIPPKAIPIDINEIFGLTTTITTVKPVKTSIVKPVKSTTIKPTTEGPLRIDLSDDLVVKTTTNPPPVDKLRNITAKEEIMEIMKNPLEKERLSKILKSRNMTIEQLVEQRERGSSQLHLADIFHNNTREPEAEQEIVGHIMPEETPTKRKPKLVTSRPQDLYTITSFPTFKIEANKNLQPKQQPFLPLWEDIYPTLLFHGDQTTSTTTADLLTEFKHIEEILDNNIVEISDDRLNVEDHVGINTESDDEDFITLPSGVKSAILASFAIVGLSLIVFLTILVIFKWSQKQKRRLNYSGSFSGSNRSPILEPDQKGRSFRSFMNETLGRKKNSYYKNHMQSMSDSIWDSDKKTYMI